MELLSNFIKAAFILFGPLLFLIVLAASPLLAIALGLTAGLTYFLTKN